VLLEEVVNSLSRPKRSAHWDWQSFVAPTWSPALLMDRHPPTQAPDLETAHLEAQALPQPWQQAQVSADRQAEAQVSDFRALPLVWVDLASLVVAQRLASLLVSLLRVSLLPVLAELHLAASHLPLVAGGFPLDDRT
jgi:hypothetical protein